MRLDQILSCLSSLLLIVISWLVLYCLCGCFGVTHVDGPLAVVASFSLDLPPSVNNVPQKVFEDSKRDNFMVGDSIH